MEIGFVGLGKMGRAMAIRLKQKGHRVITYDVSLQVTGEAARQGIKTVEELKKLVAALKPPRNIWLMLPAGRIVDDVIFTGLVPYLQENDLIIDGGNSNYKDAQKRAIKLSKKSIEFMDIGVSGGIRGTDEGLSLMVGGSEEDYRRVEPVLRDLAADNGYALLGANGAGHFVKTVHNGTEYALMQSYAEGFELLKEGPFELDLEMVSRVWNNGSIVRSWLLELIQQILQREDLTAISGDVGGGQTGRWALEAAMENGVSCEMLAAALSQRYNSRRESFSNKMVAALRHEFGGHRLKKK
ncbi:phosphogluconate dehydrogenase (NAD(+)-dependent, decarboxylating) [Chloroflexota bacterium]